MFNKMTVQSDLHCMVWGAKNVKRAAVSGRWCNTNKAVHNGKDDQYLAAMQQNEGHLSDDY